MAQPEIVKDIDARVKIAGDTMTGNLIGKYFQGTWLQTSQVADLGKSPSRIAVIRDDGWLYYRTPSELASDIGLTGNYVLKSGDTMTGNLTAPTFIGSLQGNASSSTYSTAYNGLVENDEGVTNNIFVGGAVNDISSVLNIKSGTGMGYARLTIDNVKED